jgi:polyisoprenoid-binding protein YceI
MKRALTVALLGLSPALAAPQSYVGSGTADFEYRVLVVTVRGTSSSLGAQGSLDPASLAGSEARVTLPAASLVTGNSLRDSHMRGALGSAQYPNITFVLSSLSGASALQDGVTAVATGSGLFTLRGVSKVITVPLKLTLQGGAVNVATQFKFNPHEYGVDYFGGASSIAINAAFALSPR